MSDIIKELTQQLGIDTDQAETGAGAIMGMIKEKASSGDVSELMGAVPEAQGWIDKASALTGGGGGALGGLTGMLGGAGGGLGAVVGMLGKSGMDSGIATKFLPLLIGLLKDKVGDGLFGKLASAVPMLSEAGGGGGGGGGIAGMAKGILGKLRG